MGGNKQGGWKSLKLNSQGVTIKWGLVKFPRNTASCIPANILKWFPSSFPNTTIISMTVSSVVSAFDENINGLERKIVTTAKHF